MYIILSTIIFIFNYCDPATHSMYQRIYARGSKLSVNSCILASDLLKTSVLPNSFVNKREQI